MLIYPKLITVPDSETAVYFVAVIRDSLQRKLFLVHFKLQVPETFDAELLPRILEVKLGSYGIEMQRRGANVMTMVLGSTV